MKLHCQVEPVIPRIRQKTQSLDTRFVKGVWEIEATTNGNLVKILGINIVFSNIEENEIKWIVDSLREYWKNTDEILMIRWEHWKYFVLYESNEEGTEFKTSRLSRYLDS